MIVKKLIDVNKLKVLDYTLSLLSHFQFALGLPASKLAVAVFTPRYLMDYSPNITT